MRKNNKEIANKNAQSKKPQIIKPAILLQVILFITIFASQVSHAGLKDVLKDLNTSWNVTPGGAYDSQAAGYATGGSMSMRAPIENHNLVNIRPPRLNASCAGIDAHLGSIGFIKADQLIKALKTIPSNMAGYALQLTMQTQAPQIYNIVNEMFAWMQKMNSLSINSCETAQSLVNGMWSQMNMSSDHACKAMTASSGEGHDWFDVRKNCSNDRDTKLEDARKRVEFKDQLGKEFNLVWESLKKKGPNDKKTKEMFMSISGSIISRPWKNDSGGKEKNAPQAAPLGSLALNEKFLEMMLYGDSKSEVYVCDEEDKCLYPTNKDIKVGKDEGYVYKVETLIASLKKKAIEDTVPTDDEKKLIEATSIPILKIISVQSAFKEGVNVISNIEVAEVIAWDILMNYLEDVTSQVEESLSHLESIQIDGKIIQQMKDNIYRVKRLIVTKKQSVYQRMLTTMNIIDSIMQQEQYLRNNMSNYSQFKEGGDGI